MVTGDRCDGGSSNDSDVYSDEWRENRERMWNNGEQGTIERMRKGLGLLLMCLIYTDRLYTSQLKQNPLV